MKNNTLGTIAVSNTKRPRARFNLSADLHTSMDFGSVMPARCHLMVPNSKVVCSSKERILCSPMIAPTMGRLGLKAYHNFVPLSDLSENVAPMLAQEAVSRGNSQFVPQHVPQATIRDLSFFVLIGAYMNIYKAGSDDTADTNSATASVYNGTTGILTSDTDLSNLGILTKVTFGTFFGGLSAFELLVDSIFYGQTHSSPRSIPLGNPTNATFYPIDPTCDFYAANKDWYDLSDVSPANADVVLPVTVNSTSYFLCFRLSDFGKRLRKILIGCGYQIDFANTNNVSLLPLLAFYKSYFDVFGLTLYDNWEQSYAYRFLRSCDLSSTPTWANFWQLNGNSDGFRFLGHFLINELGLCFYTDEQDYISSHVRSTAVSPNPSGSHPIGLVSVDDNTFNQPNLTSPQSPNENTTMALGSPTVNGHSYINSVLHGQLDSELLKRLYRWTNRNTIAGRRIAELLRAQGLGSYVDECKSNFIGSFELPIDIFDGLSQSDTFDSVADSGAPLGERFGNGQASSSAEKNISNCEKEFVFECNEFGYWITLFTIVPKGGYAENVDPTVRAVTKFGFYNPEFDSLGMEFTPKSDIVGSMPFADGNAANGTLTTSFGLAPRYFSWKFGRNVANGDFTRRGVRDAFSGYYLDKVIDVGSRLVRPVTSLGPGVKGYTLVKQFKPNMLPIAGNVWRYPTRYPFIGRFNRIFNMSFASREHGAAIDVGRQKEFEIFGSSDDNFIVHAIFDVQYFAPMLPVEDSFETYDDDNAPNGSMSKA